jgi:hypothetical protein
MTGRRTNPDLEVIRLVLRSLSEQNSVALALDQDGRLTVDGRLVPLPSVPHRMPGQPPWGMTGEREELLGTGGALPTVPRADVRDKLVWRMLQDALPHEHAGQRILDAQLKRKIEDQLPSRLRDANAAQAVANALGGRFYSRTKEAKVLLPLHADLAQGFSHSSVSKKDKKEEAANYRMFSGVLLPFLLWNGTEPDRGIMQDLFDVMNSDADFNRIDRLFLEVAREFSAVRGATATADHLIKRYREALEDDFRDGAFCQPALSQFAADLRIVLDSGLPRTDTVEWVTLLVSLHVGVLLYRIALVRGLELDNVIAAAAGIPPPYPAGTSQCCSGGLTACPLAGSIRFRLGSGMFQPVSLRDPCRTSYQELDDRRLLAMPATLITVNLAARAWEALGGPAASRLDMAGLQSALRHDPDLARRFGGACSAIAVLHHASHRPGADADELRQAASPRPGIYALRQDVLQMRARDLRHQSRDIVNQLLAVDPRGRLLGRNGPSLTYYEVDEQMLLLLVRIVCAGDNLPFGEFLHRLTRYGLAPQDEREKERLADTLERLGLLIRYSDAGEAAYVHDSVSD